MRSSTACRSPLQLTTDWCHARLHFLMRGWYLDCLGTSQGSCFGTCSTYRQHVVNSPDVMKHHFRLLPRKKSWVKESTIYGNESHFSQQIEQKAADIFIFKHWVLLMNPVFQSKPQANDLWHVVCRPQDVNNSINTFLSACLWPFLIISWNSTGDHTEYEVSMINQWFPVL